MSCNLVPALLSVVESVREAVGRRVKLTLRRKVQLEVKGDKVENRVLVSDSCSLLYCFVFHKNVKIIGLDMYVNCLLTPFNGF